MAHAIYDGVRLTVDLPRTTTRWDRFDAASPGYLQRLRDRPDMPDGLRVLIARLFEHDAMVSCSIRDGKHMEFVLHTKTPGGRLLRDEDALESFKLAFVKITGQRGVRIIPMRDPHFESMLALGTTLDLVCGGRILAPEWEKYNGDAR